MDLEGARVVVTGSSGFMGRRLVDRLGAEGAVVIGCARDPGPNTVPVDITDPYSIATVLGPDHRADAVIHTAAIVGDLGKKADYTRVNVDGVANVIKAARGAGVQRFIHISSIAAMGFSPGLNADEETRLSPMGDPYGDSKLEGEQLALSMHQPDGMAVTVIRPGDIWGPGSVPWVIRPIKMMKKRQWSWVTGGKGHVAMVHIDDVVAGIMLALKLEVARGRMYILTDGTDGTTCRDYFERLAKAAGTRARGLSLPKPAALALAATVTAAAKVLGRTPPFTTSAVHFVSRPETSYSCRRAIDELGYAPKVDLDSGMKALAQDLQARPE